VLLVLVDEWRVQAFGFAGDVNAHTPALDGFARESFRFPNATSGTPVCCPARASLLTGQYPLQNGVYINDVPLVPNGTTLGEAFAGAGYATGYIGKWHVFGSPEGRWERRLAYIPRKKRFGFDYWKVCECTHDYTHSIYYAGDDPTPRTWPGYDAVAQTQDAIGYIGQHARADTPFFLTLSLGPPHFPYQAPPEYAALYRDRTIAFRDNVPADCREAATVELRNYYAATAVIDDCFRDLLAAVKHAGIEDDTIIVFTADHGEMGYSQGLQHKLVPWEESVGVPLLIRHPRRFGRKAASSPALINTPDLMPTLLGLAGIAVPRSVTGTNYAPHMRGEPAPGLAASAYLSMPVPVWDARMDGIGAYRGVRTDRYTYVRSADGPWLLYDNRADPFQMHNRVGDPAFAGIARQLDAELERWRTKLGDAFLPAQAYLERDGLSHYVEARIPVGHHDSPWGDWRATLPVPASQARSIDASLAELAADPLAAPVIAADMPLLKKLGGGDWAVLSPRVIGIVHSGEMPPARIAALDAGLRALPRPR
jgi:arylsulfatase A-like enzyme